jgi:hypothetical protein
MGVNRDPIISSLFLIKTTTWLDQVSSYLSHALSLDAKAPGTLLSFEIRQDTTPILLLHSSSTVWVSGGMLFSKL